MESFFILFFSHFSFFLFLFFPEWPWHIFSLWKRGKTLLCNVDMSMHSCRGRHVENRLKSIGAAAGGLEMCHRADLWHPGFDCSKDIKEIRCILVCFCLNNNHLYITCVVVWLVWFLSFNWKWALFIHPNDHYLGNNSLYTVITFSQQRQNASFDHKDDLYLMT